MYVVANILTLYRMERLRMVWRGLKRWKTYETVYIWAKKWILLFYLVDLWRHTERHLRHHRSWKQRLRKHSDARKCHPNKVGLNCRIPYHIVSLHILAVDIDCDFIICDNGDTGIEDCIMQVFEFIWWMKSWILRRFVRHCSAEFDVFVANLWQI